jgi:hypothetical protein
MYPVSFPCLKNDASPPFWTLGPKSLKIPLTACPRFAIYRIANLDFEL